MVRRVLSHLIVIQHSTRILLKYGVFSVSWKIPETDWLSFLPCAFSMRLLAVRIFIHDRVLCTNNWIKVIEAVLTLLISLLSEQRIFSSNTGLPPLFRVRGQQSYLSHGLWSSNLSQKQIMPSSFRKIRKFLNLPSRSNSDKAIGTISRKHKIQDASSEQSSYLCALAPELVLNIVEYMGPEDLLNFRLVCKDLSQKSLYSFLSTFIETIRTDLSSPGLHKLKALSSCKQLGQYVKDMVITSLNVPNGSLDLWRKRTLDAHQPAITRF